VNRRLLQVLLCALLLGLMSVPGLGEIDAATDVGIGAIAMTAQDATTLYRVVGPDELSGILQAGQYTASPGGMEVKYFYPTPQQAANFAANPGNAQFGPFTLTSTEVPTSVINSGSTINVAGEGTVITIPTEQLPNLGVPTVHSSIPLPGSP
jgi:hypothetical protein